LGLGLLESTGLCFPAHLFQPLVFKNFKILDELGILQAKSLNILKSKVFTCL
jgi:hypothetical protein